MKTMAKLTTTISVEEIEQMLISLAGNAIAEDCRMYPDKDKGRVAWSETGEAIVSFDYETEH